MSVAPRFIFYSNEMVGLGHLRRTLTIASRISAHDARASSLVLTGSSAAPFFALPPGVDSVKLPTRGRDRNGRTRSLRMTLEIERLEDMRSSIALAAATSFEPHVAVIDKLPLGLGGELASTLTLLRDRGCKLVLGLRDIDDSPWRVRWNWRSGMRETIERFYDAILVYGPSTSMDAIDCMGWQNLDVPVHHVGYLGAPVPDSGPSDLAPDYLLATVGGGHDGFETLASVCAAVRLAPIGAPVVMVTGPLMADEEVQRLRVLAEGLDITVYRERPDMVQVIVGARAVVGMAGYNTVAEIMRSRRPALLVPRVRPSQEQLMRARRLAERGDVAMLHPNQLDARSMHAALESLLDRAQPDFDADDYHGSEQAAAIVAGLATGTQAKHRLRSRSHARAAGRPALAGRPSASAGGRPVLRALPTLAQFELSHQQQS